MKDEIYAIKGAIDKTYGMLGAGCLEEVHQNALEEELTLRHILFAAKTLKGRYKWYDWCLYEPDVICLDKIIV